MNFSDTLHQLLDQTRHIKIDMLPAYDPEGECFLGYRVAHAGSDMKDPVIDGNYFMLCGDLYHSGSFATHNKRTPVRDYEEFFGSMLRDLVFVLHAQYTYPCTTIYLGEYRVLGYAVLDRDPETHAPLCVRLDIMAK